MLDLRELGLVPLSEMEGELAHAARGIPLHDRNGCIRAFAVVDAEDYEDAAALRWFFKEGYAGRFYGGRPPKRRCERLHRRIVGLADGDRRQVDHINRDRLDNRRENLRIVAGDAENRQNVPARGGSSSWRGVYFDASRSQWVAQAKCGGQRLHRRFNTEAEAAFAAREWRREHMPFSVD